jgi:hypothetical protein
MQQSQKAVEDLLMGKTIVKIEFEDTNNKSSISIKAIHTHDGYLYKIEDGLAGISHPESEQERLGFFTALEKITEGGLVTFKAKYLSNHFIEEELKKKAIEIGANGWGQARSHNSFGDEISYRFDMK